MIKRIVAGFAVSTALVTVTPPAQAQQAPAPVPVDEPQADPDAATDEDDLGEVIEVVGQRERGSVAGDIRAEQVLRPADIRAYGVSSLTDLLTELAPQLGSGRGQEGGQPVVLLNGRRISGFREIGRYPPEAIERVDILPPEAAQQLGYRAEQRVVNFVLRRRFNAFTAEAEGGGATRGDRFSTEIEGGLLRIMRDKRLNLNLEYRADTPVYEADRDIVPTPPSRPFAIAGNLTPGSGLTQVDPALSALAGSTVSVAGVPIGIAGRPPLSAFAGGANPSQFADYRTLSPSRQNFEATANYAQPIFGGIDASLSGSFDWTRTESELGLATAVLGISAGSPFSPFAEPVTLNRYLVEGGARGRTAETNAGRIGIALNGDIGRWRWSFTGNYNRRFSSTFTDTGFDLGAISTRLAAGDPALNPFAPFAVDLLGAMRRDYARSLSNVFSGETVVNGPLFDLPAGAVRASLRTGFETSDFDARAIRSGVTTATDVGRNIGSGQARIDVPIASRSRGVLSALGNLSANAAYEYNQVSDFGWLSTYSYGLNWSPVTQLSVLATLSRDENAPTTNQLGDPVIVTPDARVFDFVRGVGVDATLINGGNPFLLAPERRVTSLTLNARPFSSIELNLSAEYTRTRTVDLIQSLSTPTAPLEAAFPDRFLRDASGQLIRVDNRPINIDGSNQEQLRWGFNFSRRLGPAAPAGGFRGAFGRAGGDRGQARGQRAAPAATVGSTGPAQRSAPQTPGAPPAIVPSGEGRRSGGPGGGGRGFGGGGRGFGGRGGNEGRLQLSVFHTWRFVDTLTIGPGIPVLDRLNGDANDPISGPRKHQIDFNLGASKSGFGVQANGQWRSSAFVRGGTATSPTDISIEPLTTIRLRSFVNFNPTMKVARDHPWLIGTRVQLEVANLFDSRPRVTDATGAVPINFQPDLRDPIGRTVSLSIRKLFFSRRQGAGRRAAAR